MSTFFSLPFAQASIGTEINRSIKGSVYARGTLAYEKRRLIHNGLCSHIYPDWIAVPLTTEDVSKVVQITNRYNVSLSVRSGGHSFTCQSTKQGVLKVKLHRFNNSFSLI